MPLPLKHALENILVILQLLLSIKFYDGNFSKNSAKFLDTCKCDWKQTLAITTTFTKPSPMKKLAFLVIYLAKRKFEEKRTYII